MIFQKMIPPCVRARSQSQGGQKNDIFPQKFPKFTL